MTTRSYSLFPYGVVLALVVCLASADLAVHMAVMHTAKDPQMQAMLVAGQAMALGNQVASLIIVAAIGLGASQWQLERYRIAGLPWYAAACIGVLTTALLVGWGNLYGLVLHGVMRATMAGGMTSMNVVLVAATFLSYGVRFALVVAAVCGLSWVWRRSGAWVSEGASLRGRAVLLFFLIGWAWLAAVLGVALPMARVMLADQLEQADIGPYSFYLAPYFGLMLFLLPLLAGALLGLPRVMPRVHAIRVWMLATLLIVLDVLLLLGVTWLLAAIATHAAQSNGNEFVPGTGLSLFVLLIWLMLTTPINWILVRASMRGVGAQPPPIAAAQL